MTHLFVALPCFGGLITAQCAESVRRLTHLLRDHEVAVTVEYLLHESLVQRARNTLVHTFMKSEATHLLFIDADLLFNPLDVLDIVLLHKKAGAVILDTWTL